MSSAELSLDISHLVTRSLKGEAIDLDGEGGRLAAKYPGLGVSADLIGKAIARATGMVDEINSFARTQAITTRSARRPPTASDQQERDLTEPGPSARKTAAATTPDYAHSDALSVIEDQLAAALAAEFTGPGAGDESAKGGPVLGNAGNGQYGTVLRPFQTATLGGSRLQGRLAAARRTLFGR